MGAWNLDVPEKMGQSGMNLALVKFNQLHTPIRVRERELLLKWAKICEQAGVQFMPVINLWGHYEKDWIRPQYHLYYKGVEFGETPCPLEVGVYELMVHKRVLEIDKL
jgi:hypothetical protein